MKKRVYFKILFLILTFIYLIASSVQARDNFALSVATQFNGLNTVQDMNNAANSYADAGYHSYGITDPTAQQLWENLYADVQFFSTHGGLNNIEFSQTGIIVGDTGNYNINGTTKQMIGTNAVHWDADTILVTYSSCRSAGENDQSNANSITAQTAQRGADVAVGFRDDINSGSSTNWNERYNERLAAGYGVYDSVEYANSFIYLFPNVKKVQIWHHGDSNIKIGKYRSNSIVNDDRNLLKNTKSILDNDAALDIIKESNPEFDINNYERIETNGIGVSEVGHDNNNLMTKYVDLQLKVGEFYTNAGYTIVSEGNTITAIYDNNVDIEKQNAILNSRESNILQLTENEINILKDEAIAKIKTNDEIELLEENITYKYYLDIETNKRYIIFSIPNKIKNSELDSIAYSNVEIEI